MAKKKETHAELPALPFNTIEELRDYVYQLLLQLKNEQAGLLLGMNPVESFGHGVVNGILNCLYLIGYDLNKIDGFNEMAKAEAPDISRFD